MKTLEELQVQPNLLIAKTGADGGYGAIHFEKNVMSVIWSFGGGWEHVSVCPYKRHYTPTWDDMCRVKDMFFRDDEAVVQYHPAKGQYVNNMGNCLHIWKPTSATLPTPPSIMVGVRVGQTTESVRAEVKELLDADMR